MKPLNNSVIVEIDHEDGVIKLPNNKKLYIDTRFNPAQHICIVGKVLEVPDKINYTLKKNSIDWKTELEIQVGDLVWMVYTVVSNPVYRFDKKTILVKYQEIIAVKRGDKKFPVNGYCLLEPLEMELKSEIIIPEHLKKLPNRKLGYIAYKGLPNKQYWGTGSKKNPIGESDEDIFNELNIGDLVFVRIGLNLEQDKYRTFDGERHLWYVQYRDIDAVIGKELEVQLKELKPKYTYQPLRIEKDTEPKIPSGKKYFY